MRLAQRLAALKTIDTGPRNNIPSSACSGDNSNTRQRRRWRELPRICKSDGGLMAGTSSERSWKNVTTEKNQKNSESSKGRRFESTTKYVAASYSNFLASLKNHDELSLQGPLPFLEHKTLGSNDNSGEARKQSPPRRRLQKIHHRKIERRDTSNSDPDRLARHQKLYEKKQPTSPHYVSAKRRSRKPENSAGNYDSKLVCQLLQAERTSESRSERSSSFWKWRKRKGLKRKTDQVERMRKSYLRDFLANNDQSNQVKTLKSECGKQKLKSHQRTAKNLLLNDMELTKSDFDQVSKYFQNFSVAEGNHEGTQFPINDQEQPLEPLKVSRDDDSENSLIQWAIDLQSPLSEDDIK